LGLVAAKNIQRRSAGALALWCGFAQPVFADPLSDTVFVDADIITYEVPALGLFGVIPIQRMALDNVAACEALAIL